MSTEHGGAQASDESTRVILRYRIMVIAAFLVAVVASGLVDRAWHGSSVHPADEVQSSR